MLLDVFCALLGYQINELNKIAEKILKFYVLLDSLNKIVEEHIQQQIYIILELIGLRQQEVPH